MSGTAHRSQLGRTSGLRPHLAAVRHDAQAGRRGAWRPNSRAGRRESRRRRLIGLLRFALFLFLIFLAVWAGVRVAHAAADPGADDTRTYVVAAGDSLWDIAARHYGDDVDLRKVVHQIRAANGLQTSLLHPGDELALPSAVE